MKTFPRWRPVISCTMSSSSRSRSTAATGRCGQAGSRREVANVADWTFDEGLVHSQRRTRARRLLPWRNRRRALRDKIADAVVAFANADEGLLLVGVGRRRHRDRTRLLRQACGRARRSAPPQADARSRLPLRAPLARLPRDPRVRGPCSPRSRHDRRQRIPVQFPSRSLMNSQGCHVKSFSGIVNHCFPTASERNEQEFPGYDRP